MLLRQTINLVTGGAGFLGHHLCNRLLALGQHVICLDDVSSGAQEHVDLLLPNPNYEFIRGDVRSTIDIRVNRIFNLACPASPKAYQADPIKTTLTNVIGIHNMLELARTNNARILHASTSEVYGDPTVHPQPENYRGNVTTTGPRACYDEGKRCAETLIFDYHRIHGVDCRIARIFNTYGPGMRQDDGRVVSNFIIQALQNRDLTIYGNGTHTRSMCYVDDLIEGLLRLMDATGVEARPFNLGNPNEISIGRFAELVIAATNSKSRIVHLPDAVDDPRVRCPDITQARRELGWQPATKLTDGLAATIDYFRKTLANPAISVTSVGPGLTARAY